MRQAFALVLLGGLTGMAAARGAYADQTPDAGHYDSRMRYVAYNPGQVVHLSTIVGATMVVRTRQNLMNLLANPKIPGSGLEDTNRR